MKVQYQVFRATLKSWETLMREAADFASRIDPQRLINISHSCDYNDAVVTVWYWGEN